MKHKTRRILYLATALILFTAATSAAVTSLDIINVFPDQDVRETGTIAVVRLEADSTTSTTTELWLTKPNGTTVQIGSHTVSVKSGNPRENAFAIDESYIDQYGSYLITANESANGNSQTLESVISPTPDVSTSVPNIVYQNEEVEDIQIVVRTQSGNAIPDNEIEPGTMAVYSINDDPDTPEVEKTLEEEIPLTYDSNTNNLESSIPTDSLTTGDYEVVGTFNITSCTTCENFTSISTETFLVRTGYDRLVYQDKWSSYTARNILNNQGNLSNDIDDVDDETNEIQQTIFDVLNQVNSLDNDTTTIFYRSLVVILLLSIAGILMTKRRP